MAKHARKLQVKSSELSNEKRRADILLCQMLPREVAEQLKMNREVKAGHRSRSRTARSRPDTGQGHGRRDKGGHIVQLMPETAKSKQG